MRELAEADRVLPEILVRIRKRMCKSGHLRLHTDDHWRLDKYTHLFNCLEKALRREGWHITLSGGVLWIRPCGWPKYADSELEQLDEDTTPIDVSVRLTPGQLLHKINTKERASDTLASIYVALSAVTGLPFAVVTDVQLPEACRVWIAADLAKQGWLPSYLPHRGVWLIE